MKSEELVVLIRSFVPTNDHDVEMKKRTLEFLDTTPQIPWSRKNFDDGHICASAWILNHDGTEALLFHHKKLDLWIQIGGHIEEGDADFFAAALREIREETGLTDITFEKEIFDIDIHVYPPKGDEPEHLHYDLRILVRANEGAQVMVQQEEGNGLAWVSLAQVKTMNTDSSVLRMVEKSLNSTRT